MRIITILMAVALFSSLASGGYIATKIHTPGFYANVSDLERLFKQLSDLMKNNDPSLSKIFEKMASCDTIECMMSDPSTADFVNRALESSIGTDLTNIGDYNIEELLNNIEDMELRRTIEEAVTSGTLSSEDVQKLLNLVSESARRGQISEKGALSALEALKRLSRAGQESSLISKAQGDFLKKIVAESDSAKQALKRISFTSDGNTGNIWRSDVSMPSIPAKLFDVSIGVPIEHVAVLMLVIATPALLYLLLTKTRIGSAPLLLASANRFAEGRRAGGVIAAYWEAVRLVEIITRKRREDNQTHREFYSLVKNHERVGEPFGKITEGYELVRYGGRREEDVIAEVGRSLDKIKRF